jgi:hypothetical protein
MNYEDKVYIITSDVEAGTLETLPDMPFAELISNQELLVSDRQFSINEKVCITSEYSLQTIVNRLDPERKNAVDLLKNKFKFREILSSVYPEYQYRYIKIRELKDLNIKSPSVIKPVRGIFGTAVRLINADTDLSMLEADLSADLRKNSKVYPDSVLSSEEFLVEDFIEGEEYAVDMFYNDSGSPCIVNIMHHPVPENKAYMHMMYNTSKKAFDAVYELSRNFLLELNKLLQVRNFVMHVEVKLNEGRMFPVEINCMRFGGMGLCNLAFYGLGVNSFCCLLTNQEPDWNTIWKGKENDVFVFFIAYNGLIRSIDKFRPNPEKLEKQFTQVLRRQLFDYRKQLAFGVYFLKETEENISKLKKIDFDDFFEKG